MSFYVLVMGLFKVLMVLAFISTVSAVEENSLEKMKAVEDKCLKKLGFSQLDYHNAVVGQARMADRNIKCATKCILKEFQLLTEDDRFDVPRMLEYLYGDDVHKRKKILIKCIQQEAKLKAKTDCDIFHNVIVCLNENIE